MKKVTSLSIVTLMVLIVFTTSFAGATDNIVKLDDSNFTTYTLEFDSIISTNSNIKAATISDMKALNAKNLELAKQMILELDLDQYDIKGLERYYLQQIELLMTEEEYILDYSVSLPKLARMSSSSNSDVSVRSSYEPFGSYKGYEMIYTTSSHTSTSRKMKETNKNKIEQFFSGTLSVAMCFAKNSIGIPYSLLTSFGGEVFSDSCTEYYAVTEKTDRLICIKDLDEKYGSASSYIPTYKDQECEASGYFIFHPNVVGEDPQISESTSTIYGATQYYNNSSQTKKNVYNHYKRTSDGYILEYSTQSPTIDYDN